MIQKLKIKLSAPSPAPSHCEFTLTWRQSVAGRLDLVRLTQSDDSHACQVRRGPDRSDCVRLGLHNVFVEMAR